MDGVEPRITKAIRLVHEHLEQQTIPDQYPKELLYVLWSSVTSYGWTAFVHSDQDEYVSIFKVMYSDLQKQATIYEYEKANLVMIKDEEKT